MGAKYIWWMLAWLSCLALPAFTGRAADRVPLEVLGFSEDGQYMAFEFSYSPAESGRTYAEVALIDVPSDALVRKPFRTYVDDELGDEALLRARAMAQRDLDKHGIVVSNVGVVLFDLPVSSTDDAFDLKQRAQENPSVDVDGYRIALRMKPLPSQRCKASEWPRTAGVRVTLTELASSAQRVLQDDSRLPSSRQCPYHYRIRRVVRYGDALVVFLLTFAPGFEAIPTVRHLAVTCRLK